MHILSPFFTPRPLRALDIHFGSIEPADVTFVEVPLLNVIPRSEPVNQFISLLGPELIWIIDRLSVHLLVAFLVDVRVLGKFCRYGVSTVFRHILWCSYNRCVQFTCLKLSVK